MKHDNARKGRRPIKEFRVGLPFLL